MVHAACWAHSRRKFFEALKIHPDDRITTRIVARIDELFSIDAQARTDHLDHAARHALRLERAIPLLDTIQQQIEAARAHALPASALGKAASDCRKLPPTENPDSSLPGRRAARPGGSTDELPQRTLARCLGGSQPLTQSSFLRLRQPALALTDTEQLPLAPWAAKRRHDLLGLLDQQNKSVDELSKAISHSQEVGDWITSVSR